jgi:hypothetical protein
VLIQGFCVRRSERINWAYLCAHQAHLRCEHISRSKLQTCIGALWCCPPLLHRSTLLDRDSTLLLRARLLFLLLADHLLHDLCFLLRANGGLASNGGLATVASHGPQMANGPCAGGCASIVTHGSHMSNCGGVRAGSGRRRNGKKKSPVAASYAPKQAASVCAHTRTDATSLPVL